MSLEIAKERVVGPNDGIPVKKNEVDFFKCLASFYEDGDLCQLEKVLVMSSSIFISYAYKIYGLEFQRTRCVRPSVCPCPCPCPSSLFRYKILKNSMSLLLPYRTYTEI